MGMLKLRHFVLGYCVTLCIGFLMVYVFLFTHDRHLTDDVVDENVINVMNQYKETKDRVSRSIEGLSRSAYVFDTVMSKEDYISRFLDSVLKSDDVIEDARVVVGDKVYGDGIYGYLDSWYDEVEDSSKINWSNVYKKKGVMLRDVYFPVFYNESVVGFVSYSINIDRMFLNNGEVNFSYVEDGSKLYSTNGFDKLFEERRHGKLKLGTDYVRYIYDDRGVVDYIYEYKYIYLGLGSVVSVLWLGIWLIQFKLNRRVRIVINRVSDALVSRDIRMLSDLTAVSDSVDYQLIKSARDIMIENRDTHEFLYTLDELNNRIVDLRISNRKLRDLYIKANCDLNELSKVHEDIKEDYCTMKDELCRKNTELDVLNEVVDHYDVLKRNLLNKLNVFGDTANVGVVFEGDKDLIAILDELEYNLRRVLADSYYMAVSDHVINVDYDKMVDRLEESIGDISKIKQLSDRKYEELGRLFESYQYEKMRYDHLLNEIEFELKDRCD